MVCSVEKIGIVCSAPGEAKEKRIGPSFECSACVAIGKCSNVDADAATRTAGTNFLCTGPVPVLRAAGRSLEYKGGFSANSLADEFPAIW
jgi:hypothetical protein